MNKAYIVKVAGTGAATSEQDVTRVCDLDCMRISVNLQMMQVNRAHDCNIYLPFHSLWVNLKTLTAKQLGSPNRQLKLSVNIVKARPLAHIRFDKATEFIWATDIEAKTKEWGFFAKSWAHKFKGNKTQLPTIRELLDGLLLNLYEKVDSRITGTEIFERDRVCNDYKVVFDMLLIKFQIQDKDQVLKQASGCDYDLWNPSSKVLYLILYILSLEPSFLKDIQQAYRKDVPDKKDL